MMQVRNSFALVLVFSFVYFCTGEEECINADEDGACSETCQEGTTVYNPGCDTESWSQRTCRHPTAQSLGYVCDYVRCECSSSQLWDEAAHACVEPEACSDQSKVNAEEERLKKENERFSYRPYLDPNASE